MQKAFFILFFFFASSAFALDLGIPISCDYGKNCFIKNYFDHNPEKNQFTDYNCGKLSDDNQISTDFILLNHKVMQEGIGVVAGDSGVVKSVRNDMQDVSVDLIGEETVRGRECGNGIVIEHKRGYETQYCHLKKDSIEVKPGEKVEKGQTIGIVGLSGLTSFPYLQFSVTVDGKPVDPFTGEDPVTGDTLVPCGSLDIYPLWDKKTEKRLKYIYTSLLSIGIVDKVPHAMGAREGKFFREKIYDDSKIMVLWFDLFAVDKNDIAKIILKSPDGTIIKEEDRKFSSDKRQTFQFMGKKADGKKWPLGTYEGQLILTREDESDGGEIINKTVQIEVIPRPSKKKENNSFENF